MAANQKQDKITWTDLCDLKQRLLEWWPGTELNRRRQPFQGCALPPELPGHAFALWSETPCVAPTRAVRELRARGTGPIIATQRKSLNQVIGAGVGLQR